MLRKNKIILSTALLLLLGIYRIKNIHIPTNIVQTDNQMVLKPSKTENKSFSSTVGMYEQIKKEIKQQEQKAWDLLQTDTNLSKEECLVKHKKNYPLYKRLQKENQRSKCAQYPKLKEETVSFVQNIVHDLGMNPIDIPIIPYNGNGSPAAADDSSIFIDEKEFECYSPEACRFFIAHEISHLRVQDQSLYHAMRSLINRKKIPSKKKKNAINAFKRFQEIRADMNALLSVGEKYACGAFKFFNKLQELDGGDNPGITHPKTSKRREVAQGICSKMGWNIENIA